MGGDGVHQLKNNNTAKYDNSVNISTKQMGFGSFNNKDSSYYNCTCSVTISKIFALQDALSFKTELFDGVHLVSQCSICQVQPHCQSR